MSAMIPAERPRLPEPPSRPAAVRRLLGLVAAGLAVAAAATLVPSPVLAQSSSDDARTGDAPAATSEATSDPLPVPPTPVVRDIMFPAVGPVTFTDTWGACRSGCTRTHKGVDIFGAKLAPLVAATDGTIVAVRRSGLTRAGNMIGIRDADGWYYLYLHLNNDAPGTDNGANPQAWIIPNRLRVGDTVRAGDVVGYLGDSGNAETTPAHLHFEIHQPGVGPINPTPSVQAARDAGRVRSVASLASTKPGRAEHLDTIISWYEALLGREPTGKELFAWADRFDIDFATTGDLIADLAMAPERRDPIATVLRAHRVVSGQRPDDAALWAGEEQIRAGVGTEALIAGLIDAAGLAAGQVGDEVFVDTVYRNARGQAPTARVRAYWLDQLAKGRARASMTAYFADSAGLRDQIWHELQIVSAFRAALDRMPSDDEVALWRDYLRTGGLLPDVVDGIRT